MSRGAFIRVGLLVLVGLALLAGFATLLGGPRLRDARTFETYFAESVTGLEVGAPVRYRGVALGRVTSIGLAATVYRGGPDTQASEDASRLVLVRFEVDMDRVGDTPDVQVVAQQGLRARLASQGVTGIAYIELDFVDPERFPPVRIWWQPEYSFIPSMPSSLVQVQTAAERLVSQLDQANIPALIGNLSGLLGDLRGDQGLTAAIAEATALLRDSRRLVAEADLNGVLEDLRGVARGVREIVDSDEARGLLARAAEAARAIEQAVQRVAPVLATADRALRRADGTVADAQRDIGPALRELRAAAANLRAVTESLRQDPSRILFGRPPPRAPEDR
jgi:ABC-type transporter Mla subunit MlaD